MTFYWRKYRTLILCSILFFYLGFILSSSFLKLECTQLLNKKTTDKEKRLNVYDSVNYDGLRNEYNDIQYAVLVLSSPYNEANRNTIRKTWMTLAHNLYDNNGQIFYRWNSTLRSKAVLPNFIKFFFVVGTQALSMEHTKNLDKENIKYKDMLLLDDVMESYRGLTEKMAISFEWFSKNVKNLKYLIKSDDDSFVRIDLIVRELAVFAPDMSNSEISEYVSFKVLYKETGSTPRYLYWGYFNGRATVFLKGKWQEPDWFLCDKYLPYALGGGYVISKGIVSYIGRNQEFLSRYHSEDVSMGVWTAALRDVNRVHDIRFDTQWKSRGCLNNMLIRHKQTSANMMEMYDNLVRTKGEKLCSVEAIERQTYRYKWDVLPRECCN